MPPKKTAAKKQRGRLPIDPGQDTLPISIRVTALQRAKLQRLGGSPWIRERIDKAKEPEK